MSIEEQSKDQARDKRVQMVEIRLRELGKPTCFITDNAELKPGDKVIVEQDKGLDYGVVLAEPDMVNPSEIEEPLHKIVRIANEEDLGQIEKNQKKIKEVFEVCVRKVQESGIEMKLIEGEYSFDRTKIILYFSAEGRVDFRNLVKDLAHIFRVRIELKQIGVRDEAKLLGGCGMCGRPLCCVSYLKNFKSVTIRMAKNQNLPLNPSKISGVCGRLLCCLEYEHKFYKEQLQGLPKLGDFVVYEGVKAKVVGVSPFDRSITIQCEDGRQKVLAYEQACACKEQCSRRDKSQSDKNEKPKPKHER